MATVFWFSFLLFIHCQGGTQSYRENVFTAAVIGTVQHSQNNTELSVDCEDIDTYYNHTLNVTTLVVSQWDIFKLYREIHVLLGNELDFIIVPQSLTSSDIIQAIWQSSPYQTNTTIIAVKGYRDTPADWCFITGHFSTILWDDNITELTAVPLSPYYHDAFTLNQWIGWSARRAQVILDVIRHLEWDQFLILYEDGKEELVGVLADLASNAAVQTRISNCDDHQTLQENLFHYFENSNEFHIVVITSFQKAQAILKMSDMLESKIGKRISVTGRSKWVLLSQGDQINSTGWMFNSLFDNVAVVSDIQDLNRNLRDQYAETDLLAIATLLYKSRRRQLVKVGSVNNMWSLQLISDIFPNTRFGFNGRLFVITTAPWPPYVYKREKNGTWEYYGFCIDLAYELSRTLNFTLQFTEPPDGMWGADMGNGSFNGLVGQVQRHEVDMIVAPIGVTAAREQVIDFTFPFFYDDSAVIMKKPDPDERKWRTYIDIFRKEVLICIAAALTLGSLVILGVERCHKWLTRSSIKVFAHSYIGSFVYLLGAMLNQGGRQLPTSSPGRIFISCWWLFCLVVAGTYSGNLIAVLTVSKDKPPFNTLEEMASQDNYKFGTLSGSMWTTLFETSPRPEFKQIYRKMEYYSKKNPDIYHGDPAVHLKMVKRGGYAYIADKGLFTIWLATNCDLMLLKEKFFPGKYALGLPNKSVYTKIFSDQVVKIYESGLLQVWVKKWWPKQSFCGGSLVTGAKTLTLIDVQSSFYIIGIGFALGLIILFSEAAYCRMRLWKPWVWDRILQLDKR